MRASPGAADRTDLHCAAFTVRQLSQDRVHELAEEIWVRSTGGRLPASPSPTRGAAGPARRPPPPTGDTGSWSVRAGVLDGGGERQRRRGGGHRRCADRSLGRPLLGWWIALLALLTGWRLRFRPSATARGWRRRARMQRRSADVLTALEPDGYLELHDVTRPGWPASLDHLVVGWTGLWVIRS